MSEENTSLVDKEQAIHIPWLIRPPSPDGTICQLLVSTPGGEVREFQISADKVEVFIQMLFRSELWDSFFTSLISSLGGPPNE
jgi:hypothetical protein